MLAWLRDLTGRERKTMLACWAGLLIRARFWRNPCLLLLGLGCGITLIHAFADFPFHNGAILFTWCAFLPLMVRWAQLECRENGRAASPGPH